MLCFSVIYPGNLLPQDKGVTEPFFLHVLQMGLCLLFGCENARIISVVAILVLVVEQSGVLFIGSGLYIFEEGPDLHRVYDLLACKIIGISAE